MMSKNFKGIYAVAVTPFKENGEFDVEAAKKHLDWLMENGIKAFCILGATGEYQSVSDEEHMAYVNEIVPYIKDRAAVLVGVSRERPEDVAALMQNAKEAGADAAMALAPFYCHPDQNEIVEFYKYLNDNVDLPFIVYNNPGSAGVDFTAETYKEILKLENAKFVKESTGNIERLTEVILAAPEATTVLCGCDSMALESFAIGAHGWISMSANFAPKDCIELYEAVAERKDLEKGMEIYRRLLPSLSTLESFPKPVQAIKCVLKKVKGIETGYVRRPRLELNEEEIEFVLNQMKADQVQ
jgi:4-hydroxy-tetrahydrodipicolinate synthase